ncbi:MAG: CotH kinase family protein [Ardenticatenaceae bacterium]|nr:CotH kinase family protein [Ardenticatenaceae bacterium]
MVAVTNREHLGAWRWGLTAVLLLTLILLWQNERPLPTDTLTFYPAEGYYQQDLAVTIRSDQPVIFTTDGSTPTLTNGARYERPIPIYTAAPITILTARSLLPDGTLGAVQRATYFSLPSRLPILSVVTDPANLWDEDTGLLTHPEERGRDWERPSEATYLEAPAADGRRHIGFHVPAGIRIHGNASRLYDKKAIRLYFRREYGLGRLDYPLLAPLPGQQTSHSYQSIVVHNGGQDFARPAWTMLRVHLLSDVAAEVNGFTTQTQPVLYFLNGELQGIYNIRHHLRSPFYEAVYNMEVSEDEAAQWNALWRFMAENDLADPANYAYVQSQLDLANLMDYHILQFYAASTDWAATNTDVFRPETTGGQWHYVFWDVDWSFGLLLASGYEFNAIEWFYTSDRPGVDRGSLPLRRLLENPDFRQQFLGRTADLLNTTLAPAGMAARVDELAAELRPDIGYEIGRWPSPSDWESSVAYLREFVRWRPDYLRQQLVDHFGLAGTAVFRTTPPASGEGRVAINGILLPTEGAGVYFQGTTVTVTAVPAPGYQFAGWQDDSQPPQPTLTIPVASDQTFTPRFVPAAAGVWQPGDVQIAQVDRDNGLIELRVARRGGLDLRGWQLTDNDSLTSTNEGTFIFPADPALADLPMGSRVWLSIGSNQGGVFNDLAAAGQSPLVHYQLPITIPPFHLGPNDNLALLTPDGRGIAFAAWGERPLVTPYSFGILQDGATAVMPLDN